MLRPFLLVGVGGSGGKTLRAVRQALELKLQQSGWTQGWPDAWQFLHVDSPVVQDGESFPAPFLPPAWYAGLVATGNSYATVYDAAVNGVPAALRAEVERALPSKQSVRVPVTLGAGMFRAVGRTIVLSRLDHVQAASAAAVARLNSANARAQLAELSRQLGVKTVDGASPEPIAVVVSSVAGGSGAGQFLDVTEAVKAAGAGATWANQVAAILYAPDVFDGISGTGIAPNALAALTETMAGLWRRDVTPSTDALYKSKKVNAAVGPEYNIGPAFTYIVGRENGTVSFGTQTDVYLAVAASISTWMTDFRVQDGLLAYAIANRQDAILRANLADNLRLNIPNKQQPPFDSMGFGRVGLGRDRFGQYCSERLAREGIERMLFQHLAADPNLSQKTESEWVSTYADIAEVEFVNETGLNELSATSNDVIDAIRPDRTALSAQFRAEVQRVAQQGINPKTGGQSITDWHNSIVYGLQSNLPSFLDRELLDRNVNLRKWVQETPDRILRSVGRSMSQNGMAVTAELLSRLEVMLKQVVVELRNEAQEQLRYASATSSYVGQMLQQTSGQDSLRPDHPAVGQAIDQAVNGLLWTAEAGLRDLCADLLDDLNDNFIAPLRMTVLNSLRTMTDATKRSNMDDGRPNPYPHWPENTIVPKKLFPALNERLLVDVADYPAEFDVLVKSAVAQQQKGNALPAVLDQVLLGDLLLDDLAEPWRLVQVSQTWIPRQGFARIDATQAVQSARFEISADPEEYRLRAMHWLTRSGTTFGAYLEQDLRTYLTDESVGSALLAKRNSEFQQHLTAAIAASAPLVKLNIGLLGAVHQKQAMPSNLIVSTIPFALNSSQYALVKNAFVGADLWPLSNEGDNWFDSAARVQHIDLFTTLALPVQSVVMDSVMRPIAALWNKASSSADERQGFWQWRRGRTLSEAIPVAPRVLNSMLRGWYVAKLLGLLDVATTTPELGPRLSVRSNTGQVLEFPHPLLFTGTAPAHDYPGIIAKSLIIALPMCNTQGSIAPLAAYHRLMDLGADTDEQLCEELSRWVSHGEMAHASLTQPSPDRAGTASGDLAQRRETCVAYLEAQWAAFKADVLSVDPHGDPRAYAVSWELREQIESALSSLIASLEHVRTIDSGV